ncbi:41065_t:CDS:2 [Gigaspora margarita]|uniref:41065_t:CDS:1 n=1 Tax=Gigaspora margarita TaxID=4874 RepID=A0ABM8W1C7_GIGMA|nr:41065_t:CDS:2 [Gigaspora margarita]
MNSCDKCDDSYIKILNSTKNTCIVKVNEIKPVNNKYLPESYCRKVVYWNEKLETGFVNENKPENQVVN